MSLHMPWPLLLHPPFLTFVCVCVCVCRTVLDVELQGVTQAAVRDSVREQCQLMDQQARDRQEALRNLHSQWQSILDFRQLVVRGSGGRER